MSRLPPDTTDLLAEALSALSTTPEGLGTAALPHLAGLAASGHAFDIDLAASHSIGAAVIIARPGPAPALKGLTPRQAEVAQAVARGLTNKAIARELGISPATVKDHVHAILSALGLGRRAELAARLHSAGP